MNAEGIAKALPVVAPAARAGKRESESEAAQKLPEIIQKFMPNGLLNCLIVNEKAKSGGNELKEITRNYSEIYAQRLAKLSNREIVQLSN